MVPMSGETYVCVDVNGGVEGQDGGGRGHVGGRLRGRLGQRRGGRGRVQHGHTVAHSCNTRKTKLLKPFW